MTITTSLPVEAEQAQTTTVHADLDSQYDRLIEINIDGDAGDVPDARR
jgi:hypothetical protein